jgi:predicted transcriptional regulator
MPLMTIRLSRQESARVAAIARRRKVTRSQVVRDALERLDAGGMPSLLDRARDLAGVLRGGARDLSHHPRHLDDLGQ